jgi:PEP-CTERM motif-containing protein
MKYKTLVAALALTLSGPAAFASLASCGSGNTALSSGSTELFGNAFSSAQSFSDCYSFSIGTGSDAFGGTLTIDPLSFLDINISSVSLNGLGLSLTDATPGVFSFANLVAGTYQLIVSGSVTKGKGWDDILPLPVGYAGSLSANAVVTPVPEPETYAMLLMGLGTVGWIARRRKKV